MSNNEMTFEEYQDFCKRSGIENKYQSEQAFEEYKEILQDESVTGEKVMSLYKMTYSESASQNGDLKYGRVVASLLEGKSVFVPEKCGWYCYRGGRWIPDVKDLITIEKVKSIADMFPEITKLIPESAKSDHLKECSKMQQRKYRETYLKEAQSVSPVSYSEFDKNPAILNCINGTLNLETMIFSNHNPYDYLTKRCDASYDEKAFSAVFDKFLKDITQDDEELSRFIQKCFGYSIYGGNPEECMFILYGATTRNGKSTLIEAVRGVLNDYASTISAETLAQIQKRQNDGGKPSEDIAGLKGIRFASVSEPADGLVLNTAKVKELTGNDTIKARFLHEHMFEFRPQAKIYIHTNYLPEVTDITLFSSGRVHVIPFGKHFNDDEQDKTLKGKLKTPEAKKAILKWLVDGYKMYQAEGLKPPEVVKRATEEYATDSDKIGQFMTEKLIEETGEKVSMTAVYSQYSHWCAENGLYPEGKRKFNAKLRIRGLKVDRLTIDGEKCYYLLNFKKNVNQWFAGAVEK